MSSRLSRDDVEPILESMDEHDTISDGLAVRVRTHLEADDVAYALRVPVEFQTGR
jgi:hypothetical protein